MSSGLHVVRAGDGPQIVLIHGSAADHRTWSILLASALRAQFTLVAYDRRAGVESIDGHVADAAALLGPAPAVVVGSSFGAVIALELVRRRTEGIAGAVLIEPPLNSADGAPEARARFLDDFDRRAAEAGGPAAGELFLRTVLGDAAFERMPRVFKTQAMAKFAEIRADSVALFDYRPRYGELAVVTTPVLLLGGERSAGWYHRTLDELHGALPGARLEIVAGAGHMLHAEASRRFQTLLAGFAGPLLGVPAPA
ncbi:MAG TPA: alpha/beta hydrolase [Kofleriaceae bacterium]|jgi:pimeloyl-ACP methyl ester carboxylesterase|nr:alpha/beta hydrolase [Kofleriaceae bacterium]